MTNNHTEIRRLLGLTFEIEGLLMLAERRDDMTPDEIYTMLHDKCARLLSGMSALTGLSADPVPETTPVLPVDEGPDDADEANNPEESEDNEAITESVAFEESSDADITDVDEAVAEISDESDESDEPAEPEPTVVIPEDTTPEPEPEPEPEIIPEPVVKEEPVAPKESVAHVRSIVLTLNDKFRFRRTLFGGSDAQMSDTLAILSGLTDTADLNDFITNDLCWDTEDPEVIDFLAVVAAAR